jgi:hypothetical protein
MNAKSKKNNRQNMVGSVHLRRTRWVMGGMAIILWCFFFSGYVLEFSTLEDFNYSKGEVVTIDRFREDIKNRSGDKTGDSYEMRLRLNTSNKSFYVDNNFADNHLDYIQRIKTSNSIEIWSEGDLFDWSGERIYQLKADGEIIIPFEPTKKIYIEKSTLLFWLAIIVSILALFFSKPEWFSFILQHKGDREGLEDFYLSKFKSRKTEELENIVENPSGFSSVAVKAAKEILKER